ncbi:type II toxin-antitoxin system PemK/MazF family toxin [Paenibacillus medicaginis]|uniref:Type II toxin-antitoxin system PemK/MazF family toxin n=1 Tax=Paenibacillus medicaginis TaxID=1470560 RepID=A0ABV5BUY5_9BACL
MAINDNLEFNSRLDGIFSEIKGLLQGHDEEEVIAFAEWFKEKADLKFYKEINSSLSIINNGIYWAFLGSNIGSEQDFHRPVLVVNTSHKSPVCTIIPLTLERLKDGYWYHVDLEESNSTALVEHIRVISKKRIDKPLRKNGYIASITENDWNAINKQLNYLYRLKKLIKPE